MTLTLAIVGRPNVGKSTLFNRLAGKKLAIVDDTPGVTRDWRESDGQLFDRKLRIIDTAGLEEAFDDSMQGKMRIQTESALKNADVVLFMVDGRAGITPLDKHFALWLRKQGKPVLLGVNKCEHEATVTAGIAEAWGLGLGEPLMFSAAHGEGIEDLYYALEPHFKDAAPEETDNEEEDSALRGIDIDSLEGDESFDIAEEAIDPDKPIKIAIVGRPNVGKSTLLNALINDERVITSPEAGTTRDAIAVRWEHKGRKLRLVDTAGLRKRARVVEKIEKMATEDTIRAIRLAQVVVLVIDATAALEKQDLTIADHIINEGRALVIALNKWDLIDAKEHYLHDFRGKLAHSLGQIPDVPFVTISALRGSNTERVLDVVVSTYDVWCSRIKTSKMNRWLASMESHNPPPLAGGSPNRLRYITQIKSRPPTFVLWCSRPDELPDHYKRYLMNGLRRDFEMPGVPIRLLARTSKNPYV